MPAATHPGPLLIVITGPTAIGKTTIAIAVAQYFKTVILSADSRQCYKELNIGVARPTLKELHTVPHCFIASHSITDNINAAFYENYALKLLQDLLVKHPVIIVTGGTGLYLKALLEGLDAIPEVPVSIRESIIQQYEQGGITWLQQELQKLDPLFANTGEMQNPQRMMRALEVIQTTGQSVLYFRNTKKVPRPFTAIQIGLEMPRHLLYERINKRVLQMLADGLVDEAMSMLPFRNENALQTVGYKELFDHFDGHATLAEATAAIQQNTRHYAKRQMTWFKKQSGIYWMDATDQSSVLAFIKNIIT